MAAVAQQDSLDRRRGDILAVHPHPVGGAAGEVDPAVGVSVRQVSGPVHAVAHAFGVGFGIVVVAGEETRSRRVDQLAHRFVGVGQRAGRIEARDGAFG